MKGLKIGTLSTFISALLLCLLSINNFAFSDTKQVLSTDIVYEPECILDQDTWKFDINKDYTLSDVYDAVYSVDLDLWAASSEDGSILISKDAYKWKCIKTDYIRDLSNIEWGNKTFVAATREQIIYSKDGVSWFEATATSTMDTSEYLPYRYQTPFQYIIDIKFDGQRFIAIDGTLSGKKIYTSVDGITWHPIPVENDQSNFGAGTIAFNGEKWVNASQDCVTLIDIKKETFLVEKETSIPLKNSTIHPKELVDICWDGTQFIALGNEGTLAFSSDGITWRIDTNALGGTKLIKNGKDTPNLNYEYRGLVAMDKKILVYGSVTDDTRGYNSGFTKILQNKQCTTNTISARSPKIIAGKNNLLLCIGTFFNDLYAMSVSKDGLKWEFTKTSVSQLKETDYYVRTPFQNLISSGSHFYLSCVYGDDILVTQDGKKLINTTGLSDTMGLTSIDSVATNSKVTVAIRGGSLYYSLNSINFKPVSFPKNNNAKYNAVTVFGNKWCAVGNNGIAALSDDGINWTKISSGFKTKLNAILFDGQKLIASGENQTILISTNGGGSWSKKYSLLSQLSINKLIYNNGQYLGVLYDYSTLASDGYISFVDKALSSSDGINWHEIDLPEGCKDITYVKGYYVLLGNVVHTGCLSDISSAIYWLSDDLKTWTIHYSGSGTRHSEKIAATEDHLISISSSNDLYIASDFNPKNVHNTHFKGRIYLPNDYTVPVDGTKIRVTVMTAPTSNDTQRYLTVFFAKIEPETNFVDIDIPIKLNKAELSFWNYKYYEVYVNIAPNEILSDSTVYKFNRTKLLSDETKEIEIAQKYFKFYSESCEQKVREYLEQPTGPVLSSQVNSISYMFVKNIDSNYVQDIKRMTGLTKIIVYRNEYDKVKDWTWLEIAQF